MCILYLRPILHANPNPLGLQSLQYTSTHTTNTRARIIHCCLSSMCNQYLSFSVYLQRGTGWWYVWGYTQRARVCASGGQTQTEPRIAVYPPQAPLARASLVLSFSSSISRELTCVRASEREEAHESAAREREAGARERERETVASPGHALARSLARGERERERERERWRTPPPGSAGAPTNRRPGTRRPMRRQCHSYARAREREPPPLPYWSHNELSAPLPLSLSLSLFLSFSLSFSRQQQWRLLQSGSSSSLSTLVV